MRREMSSIVEGAVAATSAVGGDHGLALQESPDPAHEGSAMVALVRGPVGVGVLDHAESWPPIC
jgi:hypothetical protein